MKFGIEKCAILVMKSGKRHMTEGVELPTQVVIRTNEEKETYKYYGILEIETLKQVKMKEKILKEYLRRAVKLLEAKLYSRNLVKGMNTWAVLLVRYSAPFLKSTREELKQMDQRTRKLMTMYKALHPRDDVDRLFMSGKEGRRELARIEDSVDASIQQLQDCIQKRVGRVIAATRSNTNDTRTSGTTITRKQKWELEQLYGRFKRLISYISLENTWKWLRKRNLKRETENYARNLNLTIRTNGICIT